MTIRPIFAWYDFWIGGFWDRKKRRLYLMVPLVGVVIQLAPKPPERCTCRDGYCLGLCPYSLRKAANS